MTEPAPWEPRPATVDPDGRPLAGWGRRFAAWILDGIFSGFVGFLAGVAAAALILGAAYVLAGEYPGDGVVITGIVVGYGVWLAVVIFYYTYLTGNEGGQTWAKQMLGIRVRDEATGGRIGYGRSFARWIMPVLFWNFLFIPGLLDGLWPLWDEKRQTWHDKIVRSIVVRG